jgi:hypothetical protein
LAVHEDEVTMVHFIKPLPLLLTADAKGILYIWKVPLAKGGGQPICLLKWSNKHSMEADVPISAVDSHYIPEDKPGGPQLLLLIGDEKGYVKVSDITCCISQY